MNPLAQNSELALRDIHLPNSLLWWPLAPGWWMLLVIVILIALGIFMYKNTYYKRYVKKNINLELARFYHDFQENKDGSEFIKKLSVLLKRVSLYQYKTTDTAKLYGVDWLIFLDSKLPEKLKQQAPFKLGVGKIFLNGPYQSEVTEELTPVYELVKNWINYNLKSKYGLL